MPQIPNRQDLGRIRINGSAPPPSINPNVANDIGRAGAAMDEAMRHVANGFAALGEKQQAMDDATWLAQAKIDTLTADDAIRRDTELNASEDGIGFEQAPIKLKQTVDTVKQRAGGSAKARQEYDIWSAEQGLQTGRWAANTAQGRLKSSTVTRLDTRLDTLRGLSASNPERSEEYLKAYEEEVNGYVGSAITAADARDRIIGARSSIGKASIITRAIKSPGDFGKALKAIEGAALDAGVDPEKVSAAQPSTGVDESTLAFLRQEEGFTGKAKWDSKQWSIGYGTKASGPGQRLSKPEAEAALNQEAGGVADYIRQNVTVPLSQPQFNALTSFGYNLGTDNLAKLLPDINAGNFDKAAARMPSFNNVDGEPNAAITGRRRREAEMLRTGGNAAPGGPDISKLPTVEGSIQPAELFQLTPEDRAAVTRELRPHLQVEIADRVQRGVASILSKGTQTIITTQEIADAAPLIGAKNAASLNEALTEAHTQYVAVNQAKSITREERLGHLRELVPSGNPDDLAKGQRETFDTFQQASAAIEKQVKTDPLRYVSIENESGRQATNLIASADPGQAGVPQRERAFDTLIELQKREGVADNDIRLLSKEAAGRVVEGFQQAKSGPAADQIFEGLRMTYGKHFDRLWGELVDEGMPQPFLTLRTATRTGQDALVHSYSTERAMGEAKDTKKDLLLERAGAKPAELRQQVSNTVSPFLTALQGGAYSPRLMEAYRSGVERVALYYMTQGKSMDSAVKTAAHDLYGANLEVYKTAVIPRDVYDQDGRTIERALSYGLPSMIAPYKGMIVSNIRESGLYKDGYTRERYANSVMSSPHFVTKEDASGIYVLDEHDDYVLVDTPDGHVPLSFTWKQLVNNKMPAYWDRFPGAN